MKYLPISICIAFILIQLSCVQKIDCSIYPENKIPKNLDEALEHLECSTKEEFKIKFKNLDESKASSMVHFGLGKRIRNDWHLWDAENDLYNYFKSKNIVNPDDISSIILNSFHRKLNNLNINFDEQVQQYMDYYEGAKKAGIKRNEREHDFINSFEIGDYVKIVMSTGYKDNRGIIGLLPRLYTKGSFNNCFVNGYIIKKDSIEHSYQNKEHFVDIKIDYICEYKEVQFKDSTLKKGDILKYSLSFNNIAKANPQDKKRVN